MFIEARGQFASTINVVYSSKLNFHKFTGYTTSACGIHVESFCQALFYNRAVSMFVVGRELFITD